MLNKLYFFFCHFFQTGEYVLNGACTACPAGYYCADPTTGKVECADGQYQTATGQASCNDCPAGKECLTKSGAASDCLVGYYSPLGSRACIVSI